jgi:phosphoribosylformylglycinamidine cyclo-ligase
VLLGLAASGLHANGFSLARQVLARAGIGYDRELPGLGTPAGEALLTPTRIYAPHLVDLLASGIDVHALCHITGGGLPGNLPRSLPPGLTARVDRSSWEPPPIFQVLADLGQGDQPRRGHGRHPPRGRGRPRGRVPGRAGDPLLGDGRGG